MAGSQQLQRKKNIVIGFLAPFLKTSLWWRERSQRAIFGEPGWATQFIFRVSGRDHSVRLEVTGARNLVLSIALKQDKS